MAPRSTSIGPWNLTGSGFSGWTPPQAGSNCSLESLGRVLCSPQRSTALAHCCFPMRHWGTCLETKNGEVCHMTAQWAHTSYVPAAHPPQCPLLCCSELSNARIPWCGSLPVRGQLCLCLASRRRTLDPFAMQGTARWLVERQVEAAMAVARATGSREGGAGGCSGRHVDAVAGFLAGPLSVTSVSTAGVRKLRRYHSASLAWKT